MAYALSFADLREANTKRQVEWDDKQVLSEEYYGNALAGEVGEACNVVKKLARQRLGLKGTRSSPEELAEELADVIIYTDLLAKSFNIDLDVAVRDKFNATSVKNAFHTRLT